MTNPTSDEISPEVFQAVLAAWEKRARTKVVAGQEEHVRALLTAALPHIRTEMAYGYERALYDEHKRGWEEGRAALLKQIQEMLRAKAQEPRDPDFWMVGGGYEDAADYLEEEFGDRPSVP